MKNKMNLLFILALASAMTLSSFSTASANNSGDLTVNNNETVETKYLLGDIDGDGNLTASDYLQIKNAFLSESSIKGTAFAMADVNFDNKINASDYLQVKRSFYSEENLDSSPWVKYEGKKEISFAEEPSALPSNYFKNLFKYKGVEIEDEASDYDTSYEYSSNGAYYYSYYTGLYHLNKFPFKYDELITTTGMDGTEITASYDGYKMSITGEYYLRYKTGSTYSKDGYYIYVDKNNNIIGKERRAIPEVPADRMPLSQDEIIALANEQKNELKLEGFSFNEIISKTNGIYTVNYSKKINGLDTLNYFTVSFTCYGDMTKYFYSLENLECYENYDLRGFSIRQDDYYNVIKSKADILLYNDQCECLSSKNPDDYIYSYKIDNYFITYDGKMAASASVSYDIPDDIPEDSTVDYTHGFDYTVYFYV